MGRVKEGDKERETNANKAINDFIVLSVCHGALYGARPRRIVLLPPYKQASILIILTSNGVQASGKETS